MDMRGMRQLADREASRLQPDQVQSSGDSAITVQTKTEPSVGEGESGFPVFRPARRDKKLAPGSNTEVAE